MPSRRQAGGAGGRRGGAARRCRYADPRATFFGSVGIFAARAGIIVTEKLPDRATEKERGEAAYWHLRDLLVLAGLPLSAHFNAKYGLDAVLCILIAMCE